MKSIFLNQLFIVIKRKAFKFYYLQKYKIKRGHIWTRSGPHIIGTDLGPIGQGVSLLVWRQTDYPIWATFFPIGPRSAPHQNFCTGMSKIRIILLFLYSIAHKFESTYCSLSRFKLLIQKKEQKFMKNIGVSEFHTKHLNLLYYLLKTIYCSFLCNIKL